MGQPSVTDDNLVLVILQEDVASAEVYIHNIACMDIPGPHGLGYLLGQVDVLLH